MHHELKTFSIESGLINDHINASLVFKLDKTYRLRLINMSGIAVFGISLDGHEMDVIEIDGVCQQSSFHCIPLKLIFSYLIGAYKENPCSQCLYSGWSTHFSPRKNKKLDRFQLQTSRRYGACHV